MKNEKNNRVKKMNNYIHVYIYIYLYHGTMVPGIYIYLFMYV